MAAASAQATVRTHSGHVSPRRWLGCYAVWVPVAPGSAREIEIPRVHDVGEGARPIAAYRHQGRCPYVYARRCCPEAGRGE